MENPSNIIENRPIACCLILYKPIAKLFISGLQLVLEDFVGKGQHAFVKEDTFKIIYF